MNNGDFFSGIQIMKSGDKTLMTYSVAKEDILNLDYRGVLSFIKTLDKLGGRKSFGNAFLMFDGYNHVPDELHEIPEVREYVKGLFEKVPHILYYINFDLGGHTILLTCLLDYTSIFHGERLNAYEIVKRYTPETVPQSHIKLVMPKDLFVSMTTAILNHGAKVKRLSSAEKVVYKLKKIFD